MRIHQVAEAIDVGIDHFGMPDLDLDIPVADRVDDIVEDVVGGLFTVFAIKNAAGGCEAAAEHDSCESEGGELGQGVHFGSFLCAAEAGFDAAPYRPLGLNRS